MIELDLTTEELKQKMHVLKIVRNKKRYGRLQDNSEESRVPLANPTLLEFLSGFAEATKNQPLSDRVLRQKIKSKYLLEEFFTTITSRAHSFSSA